MIKWLFCLCAHLQLSALELSRTQLLKVSEHISSSLRLSQEQLVQRLQQVTSCLEEAQGAQSNLQAELQAREDLLRCTSEALLVKVCLIRPSITLPLIEVFYESNTLVKVLPR